MLDEALERRIRALLERQDLSGAATEAVRGYGPAVLGYLRAVAPADADADEAFSQFCELLWKGIGTFQDKSSFSTWAHAVAWSALRRQLEDPFRKRAQRLETSDAHRLAAEIRSTTAPHLRPQAQDAIARLRADLTPEERALLVLRVDRQLKWAEVAQVLSEGGAPAQPAALRKRFERLTEKVRGLAAREGLLE
jgi:RNA polymerase sigma-70 factor (ECF subfamily)